MALPPSAMTTSMIQSPRAATRVVLIVCVRFPPCSNANSACVRGPRGLKAVCEVDHAVHEVLGPAGRLLHSLAGVGVGTDQAHREVPVYFPVRVGIDLRCG